VQKPLLLRGEYYHKGIVFVGEGDWGGESDGCYAYPPYIESSDMYKGGSSGLQGFSCDIYVMDEEDFGIYDGGRVSYFYCVPVDISSLFLKRQVWNR
jgi:hypothetical protein